MEHLYLDKDYPNWCVNCGEVRDRVVIIHPQDFVRYYNKRYIQLNSRLFHAPSTHPLVLVFTEAERNGQHFFWKKIGRRPKQWRSEASLQALEKYGRRISDGGKTIMDILLGYEIATGAEVRIPLRHTAIFGMSQLSGKTTTLEAIITRSGLRAVTFITKRGEGSFKSGNLITPFYRPRSDWQFVEGLVNVALNERVKYEPGMRSAIMKVCNESAGSRIVPVDSLAGVRKNSQDMAAREKSGFMKSVYERLTAYLDIVVPELAKYKFSDNLTLKAGVNVMNLVDMRAETQQLVIASTIEEINRVLDHVIVVVPEAWEMLPQSKMTPVKWVAQQFIRKGAALGNYMWIDSQDSGGLDKMPLRQVDNWLIGRMRESNEVARLLKQVIGAKVPADEIQTLKIGHFIAVIGDQVRRVYVLPVGVTEETGIKVARGELPVDAVSLQMQTNDPQRLHPIITGDVLEGAGHMPGRAGDVLLDDNKWHTPLIKKLSERLENLEKEVADLEHEG